MVSWQRMRRMVRTVIAAVCLYAPLDLMAISATRLDVRCWIVGQFDGWNRDVRVPWAFKRCESGLVAAVVGRGRRAKSGVVCGGAVLTYNVERIVRSRATRCAEAGISPWQGRWC